MNSAEWLQGLWVSTLAVCAATALLMILPRLLRARFGAGVAYASWWLLPFALLALMLPARTVEAPAASMPAPAAQASPASAIDAIDAETGTGTIVAVVDQLAQASLPWASMLVVLWLLGTSAMAFRLWRQQRRFERGLGRLRPLRDGLWRAQSSLGLPALLGVVNARIVLPHDFEHRYDRAERHLMLVHERTHRRRGDHLANFAVAALRCVFWFNPLVHLAARAFRHDQELACDQAVIAAHPDSRRTYGEAMLKTLMADRQAPLGCHWGFSHPMKERVMQLKSTTPRPRARRIGAAIVAALALGTGFTVWSAQPVRVVPLVQDVASVQPPRPAMPPQTSGNDGVYVYVELVDPLEAAADKPHRVASWLKPGDRMPVRIEMDGKGGPVAAKVDYEIEQSAIGTMTVVARAAAVAPDVVAPRPEDIAELRLIARKDGYSRIDHAIGTRGARLVLQAMRGAGPCEGRGGYRVETASSGSDQPFRCFPGTKQADAPKARAYGTAASGPATRIAQRVAPPSPPATPRARKTPAAPPAPAAPKVPSAPRAAPVVRATPAHVAMPAPVAAPAPVSPPTPPAPPAPVSAPEPPDAPSPPAFDDAHVAREMRARAAEAKAAREAELTRAATAARTAEATQVAAAARTADVSQARSRAMAAERSAREAAREAALAARASAP